MFSICSRKCFHLKEHLLIIMVKVKKRLKTNHHLRVFIKVLRTQDNNIWCHRLQYLIRIQLADLEIFHPYLTKSELRTLMEIIKLVQQAQGFYLHNLHNLQIRQQSTWINQYFNPYLLLLLFTIKVCLLSVSFNLAAKTVLWTQT